MSIRKTIYRISLAFVAAVVSASARSENFENLATESFVTNCVSNATKYVISRLPNGSIHLGTNVVGSGAKSFIWNPGSAQYTRNEGNIFAVNPAGGADGFYIGATNLAKTIENIAGKAAPVYTNITLSISNDVFMVSTNDVVVWESSQSHGGSDVAMQDSPIDVDAPYSPYNAQTPNTTLSVNGYVTNIVTRRGDGAVDLVGYKDISDPRIGPLAFLHGEDTQAPGFGAHAEGWETKAYGHFSHVEGWNTEAGLEYLDSMMTTNGFAAHAEGNGAKAIGSFSHAEGSYAEAHGSCSHAEGERAKAYFGASHAEGYDTAASNYYAHAEGVGTVAAGNGSHAEGHGSKTFGNYSHAEGYKTTASNTYAHAEGYETEASGQAAHAEGRGSVASGEYSYAGGFRAKSSHPRSFTWQGRNTTSEYPSNGAGTFNINPEGGVDGFYIGNSNLVQHIQRIAGVADVSLERLTPNSYVLGGDTNKPIQAAALRKTWSAPSGWSDDGVGNSKIYFKPSAFGANNGCIITKFTFRTGVSSVISGGYQVYLKLYNANDLLTTVCISDAVLIKSTDYDTPFTFSFEDEVGLVSDQQYVLVFCRQHDQNPVNVPISMSDMGAEQQIYYGSYTNYMPQVSVEYIPVGNVAVIDEHGDIVPGSVPPGGGGGGGANASLTYQQMAANTNYGSRLVMPIITVDEAQTNFVAMRSNGAIDLGLRWMKDHPAGAFSVIEGENTAATGRYAHAEGQLTEALVDHSHASGYKARARAGDDFAWVWQGDAGPSNEVYESKGPGTFNINPTGGLAGLYIGNTNIVDHIRSISGDPVKLEHGDSTSYVLNSMTNMPLQAAGFGAKWMEAGPGSGYGYEVDSIYFTPSGLGLQWYPLSAVSVLVGPPGTQGGWLDKGFSGHLELVDLENPLEVLGVSDTVYIPGRGSTDSYYTFTFDTKYALEPSKTYKLVFIKDLENSCDYVLIKLVTRSDPQPIYTGRNTATYINESPKAEIVTAPNGHPAVFDRYGNIVPSPKEDGEELKVSLTNRVFASSIGNQAELVVPTLTVGDITTNMVTRREDGAIDLGVRRLQDHPAGAYSVVEGLYAAASGDYSHAEGKYTVADAAYSHAAGYRAWANADHGSAWVWQGATNTDEAISFYLSKGPGTFNVNPAGGIKGFYIGATNLEDHIKNLVPAPTPVPTLPEKRVAMFIIPVNNESGVDSKYVGFELKATTNNFDAATPETVRLQFYSQSDIADMGDSPSIDKMWLYVESETNSVAYPDYRSYHAIPNTMEFEPPQLHSVVVLVDTTRLVRHPETGDGKWLLEDNEELIWCYLRTRNHDPAYEQVEGTDRPLWRPIAPVRWFKKMPEWATSQMEATSEE